MIYLVRVQPTEPSVRLVEAKSRAAALAHVAQSTIKVERPEPGELIELGGKGVKVEAAAAEAEVTAEAAQ